MVTYSSYRISSHAGEAIDATRATDRPTRSPRENQHRPANLILASRLIILTSLSPAISASAPSHLASDSRAALQHSPVLRFSLCPPRSVVVKSSASTAVSSSNTTTLVSTAPVAFLPLSSVPLLWSRFPGEFKSSLFVSNFSLPPWVSRKLIRSASLCMALARVFASPQRQTIDMPRAVTGSQR